MILCISVVSVVISPLSFLILLIWALFLFFLISLAKDFLSLFIFSKDQLVVSLTISSVFLVSIAFITILIFLRRRQWHPTPVLLPGKSHGQRSLVGCIPWGREELDTTERTSLSLFTFMHWTRKWQPTPVFLPGESQGRRSLVGCRLWGHTESDTTEVT